MNVSSFFNYEDPLPTQSSQPASTTPDFSLLPHWSANSWNTFLDFTQTLRYNSSEFIYESGDLDQAFYLVAAGQFEVFYPRPSGLFRIYTVDLGAVLGEHCFLDGQPSSFTARALTEGELVRFSEASYESFNARHAELSTQLIRDLARISSLRQRQIATLLVE